MSAARAVAPFRQCSITDPHGKHTWQADGVLWECGGADLPAARPVARTYDHRDNAGEWVHDDGSPCPEYWSPKPTAPSGQPWWCTTHQQHVHVRAAGRAAGRPVVDEIALYHAIEAVTIADDAPTNPSTLAERITDAVVALDWQDAADVRRAVAEEIAAAIKEAHATCLENVRAEHDTAYHEGIYHVERLLAACIAREVGG